ncbi:outer membrane beta-barrel protein, partial [Brevundimonas sp. A19_0]|uniref:outer membrane protein n=1 Tax=Brevundimonas sp. A19_0 TaxID=2821087 RepID=UPI001AD95801
MKVKLLASVAAAGIFAAGAASAEPNGWYGAVDAGWHTVNDVYGVDSAAGNGWDFEVEDGWAAFGRLGYRFDQNWRVELEGGYREGELAEVTRTAPVPLETGICQPSTTGACGVPAGHMQVASLMANVIYDFGDASWSLRPFIGMGAGVARVDTEFLGAIGGNRTVGIAADDANTALAAQFLGGVSWAIGNRANLDLTYRYFRTDFEFDTQVSNTLYPVGQIEGDYNDSHAVTLGLRYAFGADAPPPPPPP